MTATSPSRARGATAAHAVPAHAVPAHAPANGTSHATAAAGAGQVGTHAPAPRVGPAPRAVPTAPAPALPGPPKGGSPWEPYSPCTPGCVERGAPRVPVLRTARRYAGFGGVVTGTLAGRRMPDGPEAVTDRARQLIAALGLRMDTDGEPLRVTGAGVGAGAGAGDGVGPRAGTEIGAGDGAGTGVGTGAGAGDPRGPRGERQVGTLVVADHISWLDPLALLAYEPVTLVAKREVAHWPVVGPLARRVDTCFIDRGSLRALPDTIARVADALRQGRTVAVFPQGTTWCTAGGGTFRRALFQAAIDAGAPVRPVTIDFLQHGRTSTVPGFLGDDAFLPALHRVARAEALTIRIRTHQPLFPGAGSVAGAGAGAGAGPGADRRALAAAAQAAVFNSRPSRHG
ncbi:lysophospholipid acyltransferase family protein [Streptomyces sp. NPDC002851]